MNVKALVGKIRRRRKIPKVGDYVFASRWRDASPNDPWAVGMLTSVENWQGTTIYLVGEGSRNYRHVHRISADEGKQIVEEYPALELCQNVYTSIQMQTYHPETNFGNIG